ncbi:LOW QUALITY PROTEIN: hypothetical protein HID58_036130 [Brassica napus]|uniref:Phytosulfokine n=1 Tax=Brassica napus TaxID=3708 RepID=A0ABQ8C6V8_BRANA|nr:LOW QUALITY PROTEIN: hypothetical protein HID58_036130 [Brassica napus]
MSIFMITASVARPYSTLQSKDTCLMKSTLDAHLDYIYTQSHPKLHTAVKEIETLCETEECLMKATSNAHDTMVTLMTHSTTSLLHPNQKICVQRLSLFLSMTFLLSLQCFDPSKANFVENLYKSLIDLPLISMTKNSRL